jgi:DNA repair photolyase
VRWSNLSIENEERAALPGYGDGAVVRHFDAPGSISTRFYEVRAKSILNRVPDASRMPFRWTINPYRGCSHACVYCASGDTRVLMADGRTRELRDLQPGDRITGTEVQGRHRRFVMTAVLDKWSSIKPAYRVTLEDGTELITSDEHRFLTGRGWKHVIGSERGRFQRPHLTIGQRILGPGGHAEPPIEDDQYRRGYLCGMVRGDGSAQSGEYDRVGRSRGAVHRSRLALAEHEALERTRRFLDLSSVETSEIVFARAYGNHRAVGAIRARSRAQVERVRELTRWPVLPSLSWVKGFLAGIFDAEGSCSGGVWRVSTTNAEILVRVVDCLRRLRFDCVVEPGPEHATMIRLRGGLSERMRFFNLTDPAISRNRPIAGAALKTVTGTRVVAIEPLDMVMRMYDITTGTGDFIANGVVSHNCFARPTHTYLDFDAGRDFEREIVVKVNAPELLRVELGRPSWTGEHVALGTNTDPYQWVEGRYKLMPGIWEALRDARNACSVLTKSPLLLRDIGLMQEINERTEFGAALSIPTIDEKAWRATEPHTPNPRARMEAVAELTRVGIRTGILVAPQMPGINDSPAQVQEILRLADEAGAAYVTGIPLHLRGEVRKVFFDWLRESRPELLPRYERIYRRGAYAPVDERRRLLALLRSGAGEAPTNDSEDGDWMRRGRGVDPPATEAPLERPAERKALQQSLF